MFKQFEDMLLNYDVGPEATGERLYENVYKLFAGIPHCLGAFIDELDKYKSIKLI